MAKKVNQRARTEAAEDGVSVESATEALPEEQSAPEAKPEAKPEEAALPEEQSDILLEVKNLKKYFPVDFSFFGKPIKFLKAVDGISFKVKRGKTLGIVGESGCGKSTMGRSILRLYDGVEGEILFKGQDVNKLKPREFDKLRPHMQMVFQDPYASLSPRLTVGEIIGESARQHKLVSKEEYHDYILSVMQMCGLQPHYFERYPHEFSGGQRQRICIARALALKPELVICDEPVSALDVSIQAQVINMLIELRDKLGLTYVFISHDLSVVKHISDDVGVMYLGNLVEYGSKQQIFTNTLHPYTKALFSAVPVPDVHRKMNRIMLKGDIPSPVNPPRGCKFHTRCEHCMEICSRIAPDYKEVEEGHYCACHLYNTEEDTTRLLEEAEQLERAEAELAEKLANKPINKAKAKIKQTAIRLVNKIRRKKSEEGEAPAEEQPAEEAIGEPATVKEEPATETAAEEKVADNPATEPAAEGAEPATGPAAEEKADKPAPAKKTSKGKRKEVKENGEEK